MTRKGKTKRTATLKFNSGENIDATVSVAAGSMTGLLTKKLKPGTQSLSFNIGARVKASKAKFVVKLKDASGVSFTTTKKISVPKIIKKKKGNKRK